MKLKLSEIIIGERQRLDLGDLTDLNTMNDSEIGQICPIVVHKTANGYELVDGRRRLAKAEQLQWESIEVFERDALTDVQKNLMELFADVGRKDRTWQERSLAMLKIDRMKRASEPGWTRKHIAALLGQSVGHTSDCLALAKRLEQAKITPSETGDRLWQCGGLVEAFKVLIEENENIVQAEMERRRRLATASLASPTDSIIEHNEAGEPMASVVTPSEETATIIRFLDKPSILAKCAIADAAGQFDPEIVIDELRPDGYAILWFTGLNRFFDLSKQINALLVEGGHPHCAEIPLIWDRCRGPMWPNLPFQLSYRFGLFVMMPAYKNTAPETYSAVITAPTEPDEPLPLVLVNYCLDLGTAEGDVIWLPFKAPVLAVAQCGRVPMWQEQDEVANAKNKSALLEYYTATFGKVEVQQ